MNKHFSESKGSGLEVRQLAISYASQPVLSDVSFSLSRGQIGCLLGPSGSGKSSLLRGIAGFERLGAGRVFVAGKEVTTLPVNVRKIGFVFQDSALFPNLNVQQNIVFGLRERPKKERLALAQEWLDRVGLAQYESAMPHELSGGEQQRVALARALAPSPELVLLDEPFASLDLKLRRSLARVIKDVFAQNETTALFVTHDQEEAFLLADSVGLLESGRLRQWGSAHELFDEPASQEVASFIGESFFINGVLLEGKRVSTTVGELAIRPAPQYERLASGSRVKVLLRHSDLHLDTAGQNSAEVTAIEDHGGSYFCSVRFQSGEEGAIRLQQSVAAGERLTLSLSGRPVSVFPVQSDC